MACGHVEHTLLELPTTEACARNNNELAVEIYQASVEYAGAQDRECRFRASWNRQDRPVSTWVWRAGEGDLAINNDGTLDSLLAQNQRHLETTHQLLQDLVANQAGAWNKISTSLLGRIEQLESQLNAESRAHDRARKAAREALESSSEQERKDRLLRLAEGLAGHALQQAMQKPGSS